jgi:hypothetical protein
MSADDLEQGYRRAYRDFYRWGSIVRGASAHGTVTAGLRHLAYAAGWKKFEPLWDLAIRAKRAGMMLPLLETILSEFGKRAPGAAEPVNRGGERPDVPDGLQDELPRVVQIQRRPMMVNAAAE